MTTCKDNACSYLVNIIDCDEEFQGKKMKIKKKTKIHQQDFSFCIFKLLELAIR